MKFEFIIEWKFVFWKLLDIMLLNMLELDEKGFLNFGFFFIIFKFKEECFMLRWKVNRKRKVDGLLFESSYKIFVICFCLYGEKIIIYWIIIIDLIN